MDKPDSLFGALRDCTPDARPFSIELPQRAISFLKSLRVQEAASKLEMRFPVSESRLEEALVLMLSCEVENIFPPAAILNIDIVRIRRIVVRIRTIVTLK